MTNEYAYAVVVEFMDFQTIVIKGANDYYFDNENGWLHVTRNELFKAEKNMHSERLSNLLRVWVEFREVEGD